MVLIDTSVWIRFLANKTLYAQELNTLLGLDEVAAHELVYGELLVGDRGGRQPFLAAYERIYQAPTIPHHAVVQFARDLHLYGRGFGWIDAHLLASAISARLHLSTADSRLVAIAADLGIAYGHI